jgi:hypothetical protein
MGEKKMNRRTAGGWLVAAAAAMAFLATAAGAQQPTVVATGDGGGVPTPQAGAPVAPPPPVQAQGSPTYDALQARLAQLTNDNGALQQRVQALQAKYDGSKGGVSGTADASGSTTPVQGAASKPPTVPAPGVNRPEPPPPPDQDGDKTPPKTFGSSAKKTMGAIGQAAGPTGLIIGVVMFLAGIASIFIPGLQAVGTALMVGGVIAAAGGILTGGILQVLSK